jgi:hypothetical protein
MLEKVAPTSARPAPTWRRAAAIFVATVAVVAVIGHATVQVRLSRAWAAPKSHHSPSPCPVPGLLGGAMHRVRVVGAAQSLTPPSAHQQSGSDMDALLQTGSKTPYEHALEAQLSVSEKKARLTAMHLGKVFFDDMRAQTAAVMGNQGAQDCGVPGGATDRRRGGCVIPVDGSTADLACCTSCCQVPLDQPPGVLTSGKQHGTGC